MSVKGGKDGEHQLKTGSLLGPGPWNQIGLQEVGFGPAGRMLRQLRQKEDVNPLVSGYSDLKEKTERQSSLTLSALLFIAC